METESFSSYPQVPATRPYTEPTHPSILPHGLTYIKPKKLYPRKYLHFVSVLQAFAFFRHCKNNQHIKFRHRNFCKSGVQFVLQYFFRVFCFVHGIMCRLYTDICYRMSQNNVTTPVNFRHFLYWTLTSEIYKSGQNWQLKNMLNLFSLEISSMCTINAQTRSIFNTEKRWCNVVTDLAPTVHGILQ
jgi:hypothetical protein